MVEKCPLCEGAGTIDLPARTESKITPQAYAAILRRVRRGESQAAVAKSYGVDPSIISKIMRGRWKPKRRTG